MAPKPKFNEQICKELCTAHENGLPLNACANLCGISRQSVHNWLKEGKNAKTGKKREFYNNWQRANARFQAYHLKKINDSKDWRASQYLLQVTSPDDYVIEEKTRINADVKQETNLTEFAKLLNKSLKNE